MKIPGHNLRWEHFCLAAPALTLLVLIGGYMLGWLDGMTTAVLLIFPSLFFVLVGFGTAVLSRSSVRHRSIYALAPIILVGALFLTSLTQWPMRASFALNRDSLDTLARRVRTSPLRCRLHRAFFPFVRHTNFFHRVSIS